MPEEAAAAGYRESWGENLAVLIDEGRAVIPPYPAVFM
jgi:hypothetical protein